MRQSGLSESLRRVVSMVVSERDAKPGAATDVAQRLADRRMSSFGLLWRAAALKAVGAPRDT